jgi:GT2 family glycosyltransferase
MVQRKVDLSVIILNYNTRDLLRNCLKSVVGSRASVIGDQGSSGKKPITSHRSPVTEVIVVDNGSTDNSAEMVEKEFPQFRLIRNENVGFAAGNNSGIEKAKGRYILFLNPDTIVQKDTFKTMFDFMEKNLKVGAATCRVELPNGELDYACHRGFPSPWNALTYFSGLTKILPRFRPLTGYTLGHLSLKKIHEIDAACGAFLIVRREAGEEANWWDEDYFWYGEDLDLCYCLKKKGWKIMFVPKTKIIHYKGAASGIKKKSQGITTATKKTKEKATRASTAVMRTFFKKHYLKKYPRFIFWLVMRGIDLLERIRLLKLSLNI